MKLTASQIISRQTKAEGNKSSWDSQYEEVFKYVMPSRNDIYEGDKSEQSDGFQNRRSHLFTSVGENSADAFVNRMQSSVFPIGADFIKLKAGHLIPEEKREALEVAYDNMTEVANQFKNKSNFDNSMSEFFYDLVAGTAVMAVLEGTSEDPLNFVPIPMKQFSIDEGIQGEVGYYFRKFKMKADMIKHQWVEASNVKIPLSSTEGDKSEIELLECTYKCYDKNIWYYTVMFVSDQKIFVERESKMSPFISMRWTKASNEVYGRGVGLKALSDIKTLNKIMENSLTAQAFQLPMFMAQQDGMLDVDNIAIEPLAIIPVPSTATGNPSLVPLQLNTNHDITMYNIEDMTVRIKKIMLDSTMPSESKPNITATEIAQRQAELEQTLGSVYGRVYSELYEPLVKRIFEVLMNFGHISAEEFDLDSINKLFAVVEINTPIARTQSQREIMGAVNVMQLFQSFDPTMQLLPNVIKVPETARWMAEEGGFPSKFLYTTKEIQGNMGKVAQANAQAQDAQLQKETEATMAIDSNKAEANKEE